MGGRGSDPERRGEEKRCQSAIRQDVEVTSLLLDSTELTGHKQALNFQTLQSSGKSQTISMKKGKTEFHSCVKDNRVKLEPLELVKEGEYNACNPMHKQAHIGLMNLSHLGRQSPSKNQRASN
ncbi:hypothetical protein STEG23_024720 [Scotinomys teguina]